MAKGDGKTAEEVLRKVYDSATATLKVQST